MKVKTIENLIISLAILSLIIVYIEKNLMFLHIATVMLIIILVLLLKKISKEHTVNSELRKENEERYSMSIDAMNATVWKWDDVTKEVYVSDKFKDILKINNNNISLDEWYALIDNNDVRRVRCFIDNVCTNKECKEVDIEYALNLDNKESIYVRYIGKGLIKNKTYHLSGILTDITPEKQKDIKIHQMSYYDDITGIPNRKFFTEQLEKIIDANSEKVEKCALIFIDLDNFKNINDTYGHRVGDEVLTQVCNNIHYILDSRCTFARFGGDEFVIALSDITSKDEVKDFVEKLIAINKKTIEVNNKSIYCSSSIGISLYPDDANSIDLLLKTSDMAMHKAKKYGKNRYEFFDVDMLHALKREVEIEKALRVAIREEELYMVFQPKIMLKGRDIEGFEALVRWESKELGFVSPAEFIPVAENCGLIVELGKYIIEESFKKCKDLYTSTTKKFHVAINISDIQLRDEGFIDFVSDLLKKYELPSNYIEFEITEGVIMQSVARNIELLLKLKELGVSIALDDFGTGYSSLSYLKRLPIDVLKIDKSFVDGIGVDEKSEYIAESIINLSHSLDIKVVAEGVETLEQLGYLIKMKCDTVQGYYFSRPEKFEKVKEMV